MFHVNEGLYTKNALGYVIKESGNMKYEKMKKIIEAGESKRYPIEKEVFASYCDSQIKSISIAINRKLNGSQVEDGYFKEHWEKLGKFFLEHYVRED